MDEGQIKEKETLCYIKTMLVDRLKELQKIKSDDENHVAYGEKTAYVECLEWLQTVWEDAKKNGLDFDIEKIYPL